MKNNNIQNQIPRKPSPRKYIIAAGLILLLIIPVIFFILLSQNPKPDPASEKVIREVVAVQLNKDPNELTDADFAVITELTLQGKELCDIKLLKKFSNLKILHLSCICYPEKNKPLWMKILAKTGLYDINKRLALDLIPLQKLSQFRELYISDTPIKSIKPLAEITKLESLGFFGIKISDIELLQRLTNLKRLNLQHMVIKNFEPIKKLKNLQKLEIYYTPISEEQIQDLQRDLPNLELDIER